MKTWIFHALLLILTCTWLFETTFADLHLLLLAVSSSAELWFPFGPRELKSKQGTKASPMLWRAERKEGVTDLENKSAVSIYCSAWLRTAGFLCWVHPCWSPVPSRKYSHFGGFSTVPQFLADHVFSSQHKDFTSNLPTTCGWLLVFMATFPVTISFCLNLAIRFLEVKWFYPCRNRHI